MRSISTIFFLFATFCYLYAVKAAPYPVEIIQPDGSRLTVVLHGDEYFRYTTTTSGSVIALAEDGYYHYADFNTGSLRISAVRVSNSAVLPASSSAGVDFSVVSRIRNHNMELAWGASGGGTVSLPQQVNALVLLVQFADVKFTVADPQAHFDAMLNLPGYSSDGATGSARDYFADNFSGHEFVFDVSRVITLSNNLAYYGEDDESVPNVITYDIRMHLLVKEACDAIKGEVDFSKYDQDGDGVLDRLFIYFAGYNEAEGGGKNSIWPQFWNMNSYKYIYSGIRIGSYGCSSELMGATNAMPAGIGNFCHEMSHFLGLKDLYDVNYGSDGVSKCLWKTLSIMDEGNYNNDGRTPPYYCAIDRELSGTGAIKELQPDMSYLLHPSSVEGDVLRALTSNEGEYYLIENRSQNKWDSFIGGSGMLVYHIDKSSNVAGGIRASVRWSNNLINANSSHECADLIEAFNDAASVSQVFFPGQGQITEFSASSIPAFEMWTGDPVGLKISGIVQTGDDVAFRVSSDNTERLLPVLSPRVIPYQTEAALSWSTEKQGTFSWVVSWNQEESTDDGDSAVTDKKNYLITGLAPKTEYSCRIYYSGRTGNGDTTTLHFTTLGFTSSYPYIYNIKNKYSVGDTIRLHTLNVIEEISSQEWYVDGASVSSGEYVFTTPGKKTVKSVITYAEDHTQETITKLITVKEEETE